MADDTTVETPPTEATTPPTETPVVVEEPAAEEPVELTAEEENAVLAAALANKKARKASQSLAARAWNETKGEDDLEWDLIPNLEFKEKQEFAAERAKVTGIAQTNFEQKVVELHKADLEKEKETGGPLAKAEPLASLDAAA